MIKKLLIRLAGLNPDKAKIGDIEPCGYYTVCPRKFEIHEQVKELFTKVIWVD